jgi:hypothetical protein
MPRDTMSEDMSNGTFEARKVPGSDAFNVYNCHRGTLDGHMFAQGPEGKREWFSSRPGVKETPYGPYPDAIEAFKAWGNV